MDPLERITGRPTWLLSRANARAHAILGEALAAEGVRGYHVRCLAALEQYGPCSQADLGRRTGIDRSDVVAVLNDLVGDGLAVRQQDADDRRRNLVSITTSGRRRLGVLDGVLDRVQDDVLAPLDASDRRELIRLLGLLARSPE